MCFSQCIAFDILLEGGSSKIRRLHAPQTNTNVSLLTSFLLNVYGEYFLQIRATKLVILPQIHKVLFPFSSTGR